MIHKYFFIFSVFLIHYSTYAQDKINKNIEILEIERSIDLSSQLVKVLTKIVFENTGSSETSYFLYAIEPEIAKYLSYIGAQDLEKNSLKIKQTTIEKYDNSFWKLDFKEPISPAKPITIEIESIFTHALTPYPATISQKEKQYVLYYGNIYQFSPYSVAKQITTVNLSSRNVESFTKKRPVVQSDNTIIYGPYENIPPFTKEAMTIHLENNSPFLTITSMERIIEVSHWGNIAVEENINLLHSGAKLKGSFSRYEYQRESQSGISSVKYFKTILPASASDAYYRDEIGNISTSNMKIMSDSVELDLRPRFPLFGGWKTYYMIGYNVPSYEYLYNSGDDYLLKMRFLDHVFDDMVVDELVTKIILPEGSHDFHLTTSYPVDRLEDSLHFTYLDTKGRPVISIRKTNLVENHIQNFELRYTFPRILMLQEPFLVVIAFFLLFLLVIIYVRLDFSITKDELGESRMKVAGFCEKIIFLQEQKCFIYRQFDDLLAKLKGSKDVNSYLSSMKHLNIDHKNYTSNIAEILAKLKTDATEVADKITDLQKLDKQLRDVYNTHQNLYVDKLIPGKIGRQQFMETENMLNKKKEEFVEKISNTLKSLQ